MVKAPQSHSHHHTCDHNTNIYCTRENVAKAPQSHSSKNGQNTDHHRTRQNVNMQSELHTSHNHLVAMQSLGHAARLHHTATPWSCSQIAPHNHPVVMQPDCTTQPPCGSCLHRYVVAIQLDCTPLPPRGAAVKFVAPHNNHLTAMQADCTIQAP